MKYIKKILEYLILTLAFSISFNSILIDSVLVIVILLLSLIKVCCTINKKELKNFFLSFYPFILLFLILLAGLSYSENLTRGLSVIERSLSLIIFPIIFYINKKLKLISYIPMAFVIGVLMAALYCNLYQMVQYGSPFKYGFSVLLEPIDLQPTYFSMYLLLAISFCVVAILRYNRKIKAGLLLLIAYFGFFIIKLGSKAALVVLSLVLILSFFLVLKEKVKKKYLIFIPVLSIVVIVISYFTPLTYYRFYKPIISSDFDLYQLRLRFIGDRYYVWKCAIQSVSSDAFMFGHGTGDECSILTPCYEKYRLKHYLNPHNVFLSTVVKLGLIGLIPMVLSVSYGFWKNGGQKSFMLFSTIIMTLGLTESLFDRAKGIVFFGFFSAFFVRNLIVKTNK